MSDPSQFEMLLREWSHLSIPVAVLVASLLGSTHCASMCGPIAITLNNSNSHISLYHIGRLISYLTLGLVAGLVGETFLSDKFDILSTVSIIMISAFLIYTGYRLVKGKPLELLPTGTIAKIVSKPAKWSLGQGKSMKSLTIGIVNGFLPCGWVYIFVVGAVATKNPLYAAGILFIFWLGTLPALSIFPFLYKRTINRASKRIAVIAGIILIAVGVINITMHLMPHSHSNHNAMNSEMQTHDS